MKVDLKCLEGKRSRMEWGSRMTGGVGGQLKSVSLTLCRRSTVLLLPMIMIGFETTSVGGIHLHLF
jgi:hypothetical protein